MGGDKRPHDGDGPSRKGQKRKYFNHHRSGPGLSAVLGPGVYITGSGPPGKSLGEAFRLLEEAVNIDEDDGTNEEAADDVGDQLDRELAELKNTDNKPFRSVRLDVRGITFISLQTAFREKIDVTDVVHEIVSKAVATKMPRSRFIMRFLPVAVTCKATYESINDAIESAIPQHFESKGGLENALPKSFGIVYQHRFDTKEVEREKLVASVATFVHDKTKLEVDLKAPDLTIMIQVIKTVAMLSFLRDYQRLRKFNLQEASKGEISARPSPAEKAKDDGDGGECKEEDDGGDDVAATTSTAGNDGNEQLIDGSGGDVVPEAST